MARVSEVRSKQRIVIEFLLAEKETVTNIHRRLQNVYGDLAVDKSTVSRWAKRLSSSEQGQGNLSDLPRSGRPHTAVTPKMVQRVDTLIHDDPQITTRQLAAKLDIAVGSVNEIIHQLGYSKIREEVWDERNFLMEIHNRQRNEKLNEFY